MLIMTYSEARQNLAAFLTQTLKDGAGIITRADGTSFRVTPEVDQTNDKTSPFADVKPLKLKRKISRSELLDIMNDSRASVEERHCNILVDKPSSFFGCFKED